MCEAGRRGRLRLASAWPILLTLGLLGCDAIPPFPGTGQSTRIATPTAAPPATLTPQPASSGPLPTAAAPTAPAAPTSPAAADSTATPTSPPPAGPLATFTALVPGGLPTSVANLFDRSTPAAAATPAPGTGAESPEAAVQRAYEAAANGDNQALKDVTDPAVGRHPLPVMEAMGRTGRKLTLIDVRYQTTANDGSTATVHVTGRIGNILLVGERNLDETEAAKKLGNAWYLTR